MLNILAIYCPPLIVPINGSISTFDTDYMTLVNASCTEGYAFPDYNQTIFLLCILVDDKSNNTSPTLRWNDTLHDCRGENLVGKSLPIVLLTNTIPKIIMDCFSSDLLAHGSLFTLSKYHSRNTFRSCDGSLFLT